MPFLYHNDCIDFIWIESLIAGNITVKNIDILYTKMSLCLIYSKNYYVVTKALYGCKESRQFEIIKSFKTDCVKILFDKYGYYFIGLKILASQNSRYAFNTFINIGKSEI